MTRTEYQYSDDLRVVRKDYPGGKKSFFQQHREGSRWVKGATSKPWPLYQVTGCPDDGPIFVVEGEKCAEAMKSIGLFATTSLCGSGSARHSDWSTVALREIVIIPDNDGAGAKYADEVAAAIRAENSDACIRCLRLEGLKGSQDVADFIEQSRQNGLDDKKIRLRLAKRADAAPTHVANETAAPDRGSGRNNELTSLAGKLRRDGLTERAMTAALLAANQDRFDVPLPDEEVKGIARSVSRYSAGVTPRSAAEFQPFPIDALPDAIRSYTQEASEAIGCDPSYIATPLLACLAAAIGPTHRIELKPSWHEYAVIWSLIVGKSGTQKSPALDAAVRFLQEIDKAKARQFRAAIADYIENHKQWTKDHKAWKAGGGAGAEPEEPQRPKRPRHICSDTTIEAAAQLLDENPRGLLLFRDEMSGWIGSFGRYSGAGSADASGWLELFGCRPLTIDRKTGDRPTIWVERPFLCVTGSIQPSTLKRSLREEHLENGLAARLLIAFPPVRERKWSSHSASQEAIDAARNVFRRLVALGPAADAPASMEPRDLVLSRRARELWVSFFDAHARQSAALGEAEAAAWSKLEAYTARLALVINLVRFVSDEPGVTQHSIDGDSMRMAVQLAKWYGEEAIRVYAMLHESKAESERRDLIDVIRRHGGRITANDLRIASRRFKSNEQSNAFLDSLAKSGQGRWTKQSTTPRGGRPTRVFELNSPPTETETQPPRRRKKDSGNGKRSRSFKERWKHCIEINRAEGWIPKVGHP